MSIERGSLLFQTGRHEQAEREFRATLVEEPQNALAHAMVGLCLVNQEKYSEATAEAEQAIAIRPDWDVGYSVLAAIFTARDRLKEAAQTIEQAIRLDPYEPGHHAQLAEIRLKQRQWPAALEAADAGLAIDPEHAVCVNARGIALVNLGRRDEASATIGGALHRNPLNATTHANQGWALLHSGDHKAALEHFREALRLNPNLPWARAGIVEALKARNIIYRVMLKYFLYMSRLGRRAQWGIILGGYFGSQVLNSLAENNPAVRPFVLPLLVVYVCFAVMTWLANPLFNLMLRLDKYGRYALSRDQRVSSNWIGLALFSGIAIAIASLLRHDARLLICAVLVALLSIPLSAVYNCASGWPRRCMAGYTGLMACLAAAIAGVFFTGSSSVDPKDLINAYTIGLMLSTFVANYLTSTSVRR